MADSEHTDTPDDHDLLQALGEALRASDPAPEDWYFAGRGSYTWRRVDAELAELAFDSAASAAPTLVRGPAPTRLVAFEAPTRRVELEVEPTRVGTFRVRGQLVPETAGTVELRQPERASLVVEADDHGCFAAEGLVAGPLSLRCTVGGTTVDTAWLTV